jgi:5-methyltetrahydrofolate--homocysteine methyltransferase
MSAFIDRLCCGRVTLMDGATGTELMRAGWWPEDCFERLNLTRPEQVRAIHQAYAQAGAEVLLTNTFQADFEHLGKFHLHSRFYDIYDAATRLAREAAPAAIVLADIGPRQAITGEQIDYLLRCCHAADGILLETWSDPDMMRQVAALHAESASELPLLVSFTFRRGAGGSLTTFEDRSPEECAESAQAAGLAALGANCGIDLGVNELVEIVGRYRQVTELPLFVRPNAGTPRGERVGDSYETPENMAGWLPALLRAGVTMIGGCCGTTPAHIAAFRQVIEAWNARLSVC